MSSKNNENYPPTHYWDQRANKIETRIGKWTGGEDIIIRDKSLLNDLFDKVSYMRLHVLNITGRLISEELGKWLENNFMVMSYPDSRIWCNHIGALCGTMGTSPSAGTIAGTLGADSRVYGGAQSSMLALQFLAEALIDYQKGVSVIDIVEALPTKQGKPAIIGFARPINRKDERIEPHRVMSKRLGFDEGEYMQLANKVDHYVADKYKLGINIGGYMAAFLLDQGFNADESYRIKALCVNSGVMACYVENYAYPENSLLPLKCNDIDYLGAPKRSIKN
ncbi:MAG: hypothetical protein MJK12_12855 [Colwellia sp.]|nr:hypothetical protein [Colwellia sp.]